MPGPESLQQDAFLLFSQQEFIFDALKGGNTLSGTYGREAGDARFSLMEEHRGHTGVASEPVLPAHIIMGNGAQHTA